MMSKIEKIVKIIKKIKIRNIIILILLIIFNTYAWFIYATKVATDITVHIASWNVEFATGEDETTTNILIQVDKAYPGMENYVKEIQVKNKGEMKAELNYNIKELKVLDERYIVGENITKEELQKKVETEYPFKINIIKDDAEHHTVKAIYNSHFCIHKSTKPRCNSREYTILYAVLYIILCACLSLILWQYLKSL